jgi:hypothetical protein
MRSPTSKVELEQELDAVVQEAYRNNVTIEGAYVLRHPETTMPDWELICTRVE